MSDTLAHLRAALANRYTLERELGRGGMATVYLARDLKHDRRVALKVLRPELAAALGAERFLQEIRTTAQLAHPHILPLHDSGEAAGFLYYTMPFVEGESLRARLERERQLPLEDALQITREVADALGHAHALGIVHRDIKPENILFQGGHAVVADFGIAKAVSAAGATTLTETGLVVGTPAYMSPEQAAGDGDVDGRSDLYSLGCVLYEMLSGETPYLGHTPQAILAKKLSEPVPRVSVVRATVPAAVEVALTKALARTPADRYRTAGEFAGALTLLPAAEPSARRTPAGRWVVAAGLAVLAGAVGIAFLPRSRPAPVESDPLAITPDVVAVLPFRLVSADTGSAMRALALGLPELFAIKITGEFGPRVSHPPTVLRLWKEAGGSLATPLDDSAEIGVARTVGAGRLVRGTLVATDTGLVLTGEVVSVPGGEVRVRATSVEGRAQDWLALADRLAWQLLALDIGVPESQLPRLTRYKPRAIQAWLAGLATDDIPTSNEMFRQALAEDSTMVMVALDVYSAGELDRDSAYARLAWEHQDQLTPGERAYLLPLAGWRFGATLTMAQRIEQYRALVRARPEDGGVWGELGENLATFGPMLGLTGWQAEARRASETAVRVFPEMRFGWWSLLRLAFLDADTALVRQRLARVTATTHSGYLLARLPAYRWRFALLRGDSLEAERQLAEAPDSTWIPMFAVMDVRGLADADRVVAAMGDRFAARDGGLYPRVRGRHQQWLRDFSQWGASQRPVVSAAWWVRDALFLDGPRDSATMQAALLERAAEGRGSPPPTPAERAHALCWSTLWRLGQGDTLSVQSALQRLAREVERPSSYGECAGLITLSLALARGSGVEDALARLDSVVREGPMPAGHQVHPLPPLNEIPNLILARLLAGHGDTAGALAASRRRVLLEPFGEFYEALPEMLREEGRLARLSGDTGGAIRAYGHYLALREEPDYPPWRAVRDSVRRELAALVGR